MTTGLLAALGFVAAVGPIATDMYLASFTDIADDLGAAPSQVQSTLMAFMVGVAVGQLLLGPLTDQWGRRRVLVIAMAVFAGATTALVFSPTIEVFIGLRLVQGLSGASGVVIARAIAVDLSTGATAVRAISIIATVGAVAPIIAPPIGGAIAGVWGWRGVIAVIAAVAWTMFLTALIAVPESLPPGQRQPARFSRLFSRFAPLISDRAFRTAVVAYGFGFATLMSYIAASPFVGQSLLGMSPFVYSLVYVASAVGLVLSNLTNAAIAPRFGPQRMMMIGVTAQVTGAALMLMLTVGDLLTPVTFAIAALIVNSGTGYTMANSSALALAHTDASSRGAGAALLGAAQFLVGGIASPIVGLWGQNTALPMAVAMTICAVVAATAALATRRHG
ncbi:multidrug effflux MFS transporter [Microbacterium sp.]|uniref:multidrug effflux MFS transporter n=1 Tax=Microbacterium sp. TaxID=51671 RepID=UPI003A890D0E